MHEPDPPDKDHRISDPNDTRSFGDIILTIIKYFAILIGILVFLVIFGLFALYLVCAFGSGGHF